jgi:hypothetical protein
VSVQFHVLDLEDMYNYAPDANNKPNGYKEALEVCLRKLASNGYVFHSIIPREAGDLFVFTDEQNRSRVW